MREPEFLPEWYHRRLRRSRRRRAFVRASVALSLVVATGIAVSPERAPAVVTEAGGASAPGGAAAPPARHKFPAGAPHAFYALHQATPTGVVVSSLSFLGEGGVTLVELRCVADDETVAVHFEAALRRSHYFRDVEVTRTMTAASPGPVADAGKGAGVGLRARLSVAPAEAR